MTGFLIGLEVVPLRPLVPGVQKHQPVVVVAVLHPVDLFSQPAQVGFRGSPMQDDRIGATPGSVVPSRDNGGIQAFIPFDVCAFAFHGARGIGVPEDDQIREEAVVGSLDHRRREPGLESEDRVEPFRLLFRRVAVESRADRHQKQPGQPGFRCKSFPEGRGTGGIGQTCRPVDQEERFPLDANMARVPESPEQVLEMGTVIRLASVRLRLQDLLVMPIPSSRPVLVCPCKAKREIGSARAQHLIEGQVEQPFAVEPVVPVAEALDPGITGSFACSSRSSGTRRS